MSNTTSDQQHAPGAASTSHGAAEDSRVEYLEQKYGNHAGHVGLSREEVESMVDKVLKDSPTVQYMLKSLKQVKICIPARRLRSQRTSAVTCSSVCTNPFRP